MPRIGRGIQPQGIDSQGPLIGPFKPTVLAPVVTTLSVNLATGLLTNQRRAQQRRPSILRGTPIFETGVSGTLAAYASTIGPQPPLVIDPPVPPAPPVVTTLAVTSAVQSRRQSNTRRFPLQGWAGDGHLATASPVGSGSTLYRGGWFRNTAFTGFGLTTQGQLAAPLFVPWATSSFVLAVALQSIGSPTDNVVISIQGDSNGSPDGNILASFTVASGSLTSTNNAEFRASLNTPLNPGTRYWVVYARDGALDNTNRYGAAPVAGFNNAADSASNPLYNGQRLIGSLWSVLAVEFYWKVTPLDGPDTGTPLLRRSLGPKPPEYTITVLPVPVAPIQVNLATGLLMNQRRYEQRRPHSFLLVVQQLAQPPPVVTTITVATVKTRPRRPASLYTQAPYLSPLAVVTTPGQLAVAVHATRTRPRPTRSSLPLVVVTTAAFVAPPISVNLQDNRLRGFGRRHFPSVALNPPTVLQTFAGPRVTLAHTRPRPFAARYITPATLEPETVFLAERQPRILLVHTRPRHTQGTKLSYVVYAATSKIAVALVRTRPRPVIRSLTAVSYPQTGGGFAHLVRTRPRPTSKFLAPPSTLQPYAVTVAEDTVRVAVARTRPRPTTRRVLPPTVLQVFTGPATPLVRTRPRPTQHRLTAITYPAASTIRVTLARTRPRPTSRTLGPLVFYAQTSAITVALARTRPRHTAATIRPPAITSVAQAFYGPTVLVARTRPRHVTSKLAPPVFYAATSEITVAVVRTRPRPTRHLLTSITYPQTGVGFQHLTRTRPRPTTRFLLPPATLQPYAVTIAEDTIRVTLTRTRPRPTIRRLAPPTVLQTFAAPRTPLVRIRPRHTVAFVAPPATLEPEAVSLAEREIRVVLTRTRPRHTVGTRLSYTVYPQTSKIAAALARTRPRPTVHLLTAVSYPATSEITVVLTRTRPRPTTRFLAPPTTLQTFGPPVEVEIAVRVPADDRARRKARSFQIQPVTNAPTSEIGFTLTRIRPRPTRSFLTAVTYPATSEVTVALVRARSRPLTRFVAPPATLQPYSVTIAEDTVRVTAVRTRPRHTLGTKLNQPTALRTFAGPAVTLAHTRPRPTLRRLAPPTVIRVPSVEQREQTVTVALVRTRPRPTEKFLVPPLVRTFPPVVTTLLPAHVVKTRPRPTRKFLRPPTVVIPLPTLRMQTITVATVRTRPRPTRHSLTPLAFYKQTSAITVALARTRPRPTTKRLGKPIFYKQISEIQVVLTRTRPRPTTRILTAVRYEQTSAITVALARIRPRPTRHFIAPPTALQTFGAPVEVEIAVRTPLEDRARRRPRSFAIQPVTVAATSEISVTLTRTRPRPTSRRLARPAALSTFQGPTLVLARIRPRRTVYAIRPPATLEPESVALAEREERVTLARTRPRPIRSLLRPPTVVRAFVAAPITVTAVRTRPRPTHAFLLPPTVVRTFVAQPILVATVATRPRQTTARIEPPTRLRPVETTIRVALARTRPRRVHTIIPAVRVETEPPVVTTITVELVRTRPRQTRSILRPPATLRRVVVFVAEPIRVTTVTARPPRTRAEFVGHFPIVSLCGWTSGEVVAATDSAGSSILVSGTRGGAVVVASTESEVKPVAESRGEDSATGRTEGMDKLAGT